MGLSFCHITKSSSTDSVDQIRALGPHLLSNRWRILSAHNHDHKQKKPEVDFPCSFHQGWKSFPRAPRWVLVMTHWPGLVTCPLPSCKGDRVSADLSLFTPTVRDGFFQQGGKGSMGRLTTGWVYYTGFCGFFRYLRKNSSFIWTTLSHFLSFITSHAQ